MSGTENGNDSNHEQEAADGAPSGGPKSRISDSLSKPLPKRFYKAATLGEGPWYPILLDGRAVKTPKKRALALPTKALAQAVRDEWDAQKATIDPSTMPLTRFANTAIDAVADTTTEVAADIVAYAGRDLLCYRAQAPLQLVERQSQAWNPIIDWARDTLGARFIVVESIMPVDQPVATLERFAAALEPLEPFRLTGLHVVTTLTGSALLTLALDRGFLPPAQVWGAAHVDEDYQITLWGEDYEAGEKRKQREAEFNAASRFLTLLV